MNSLESSLTQSATEIELRDSPSCHGAILGEALALLAEFGRKDASFEFPECCLTCAFRRGSMSNEMASTGKMALDCVLGIDKDRFACHHGMKEGQPQKLCVGYIAATLAPWSAIKEVVAAVKAELDKMDGPDGVRAAFQTWYVETDPEKRMDVYQLARAYAMRFRETAGSNVGAG